MFKHSLGTRGHHRWRLCAIEAVGRGCRPTIAHACQHGFIGHVLVAQSAVKVSSLPWATVDNLLGRPLGDKNSNPKGVVGRVGLQVVAGDQSWESVEVGLYFQQLISLIVQALQRAVGGTHPGRCRRSYRLVVCRFAPTFRQACPTNLVEEFPAWVGEQVIPRRPPTPGAPSSRKDVNKRTEGVGRSKAVPTGPEC